MDVQYPGPAAHSHLCNRMSDSIEWICASSQIVSDTQWRSLSSSDFATYKAIVVGDPNITPRKDQNLKQDGACDIMLRLVVQRFTARSCCTSRLATSGC